MRVRLAVPDTHSSETVYLSARGSQATLPIHTPWTTSLNRRPRFLPRMVSKVPPSKGPLRGSICQGTMASEGLRPGVPLTVICAHKRSQTQQRTRSLRGFRGLEQLVDGLHASYGSLKTPCSSWWPCLTTEFSI